MIYASNVEGDSDHHPHKFGKSASAETKAFSLLSAGTGTRHWLAGSNLPPDTGSNDSSRRTLNISRSTHTAT